MKNCSKRLMAMALCIVMLFSLLPNITLPVAAAGETIYVLAGGDYQEAGDHSNSANNVARILTTIVNAGYDTMDGFLFIGDYDCETHDDATQTAAGITSLMDTVDNVYTNLNDDNTILVQGNHDYMDSRIDATGGHDFEGYSVYVLNEDDYADGGGSATHIAQLAADMKTWLDKKLDEGYSAPIFITSHLPLAYSPRTHYKGDGKYASYLFNALNQAAEDGLNIIFLYGHNHAYGADEYLGGEAVFLKEGDPINIPVTGDQYSWTEETLNFTYMNAGYVGYYNEVNEGYNSADTDDHDLTMTVFAITDDEVTVSRYSAYGTYDMKSDGEDGYYGNTSTLASTLGLMDTPLGQLGVYGTPQTITLTSAFTSDEATIGAYVGVEGQTPADDVTPSAAWTEIIAPIPDNTGADDVTPYGSDWTTITAAVPGSTTYAYEQATSITGGSDYVIVANDDPVAFMNSNNTMGSQTVEITGVDGSLTMTSDVPLTEWTFSGSGSGTIYDGNRYLRYNNGFTLHASQSTNFTFTDNGNNFRIYYSSGWQGYYFYYDGSDWTRSGNRQNVRLFTRTDDIITQETAGLYTKLNGDLTYYATAGMTADEALALVASGITVQKATASDYSDAAPVTAGITFQWRDTYDADTPGDYAVEILYNNEVIGVAEVITPAIPGTPGTYYKLSGELSYAVELGTPAETALATVDAGLSLYSYQGMSAPAETETGTLVEDADLTLAWADSYDPNTSGDYGVTVSYDGKTLGTAEVIIPTATTYYIAEGPGLYIMDMNTSVQDAMAAVQAGVTISSAIDAEGTNKQPISDGDANVTWNWVDTYDGENVGPYTVEIFYADVSLGSVEVKVDVQYDTSINEGWTYVGESEATGGTHTYTLDTNGIDAGSGNRYLIVARDQAYLLNAGSAVAVNISSDGTTATTDTRDYEYYFTGATSGLITRDGTNTLYQQNWGIHTGYIEDSNLDAFVHNGNGYYRLYDNDGTARSLYYNGSSWTVTSTDHTSSTYNVRLYKYTGTTGGTPAGPVYAQLQGSAVYYVANGTTTTSAMNTVKSGITGYLSANEDGTDATAISDSDLTWSWKNDFNGAVDGSYWVDISYNGVLLGTVEVIVQPGVVNNYPEYPDEGAVKVSKTATGIDFQSSGIAQVEISASGVPSEKGADVVVMLDTSSSMTSWCICGVQNCTQTGTDHQRRNVVLEESLKDLIASFQADGPDGNPLDIRVAIADFNGFYSSGAVARDADDTMADGINYDAVSQAMVYTGNGTLSYDAFVDAADLAETYTLNYTSGTNYDYAFDAIYQLGEASRNCGEDRDLYVIFMSDGAAMQWNYYHSQGQSNTWGEWITGTYTEDELADAVNCNTHTYYYNLDDTNGDGLLNEHRMANAVKGSQSENFEVIRKAEGGIDNLNPTDQDNIYTVPGLGATVFSIAFAPQADGNVEAHYMTTSISTLATEQGGNITQYYYVVETSDELSNAFTQIGTEIAYAAYNARFVDQMGSSFNLQLTPSTYTVIEGEEAVEKTIYPDIQVLAYDIYQASEVGTTVNGQIVTEDMVGQRKGTSYVAEYVMFSYTAEMGTNAAGDTIIIYNLTGAYSSLIDVDGDGINGVTRGSDGTYSITDEDDNILGNGTQEGFVAGVIYARTFVYNTTDKAVAITGISIPTTINSDNTTAGSTNVLPSETFYWNLGTIQTTELAMRYYVYLDGSMEGTKAAGSYQTNEFATLYYDNYLGNSCYKDTVSPVIAWKSAKVSYAFYLVNDNGEIIVNQTTGETGTFAHKVALTSPVVYQEILLNNIENVANLEVAAIADDVLPDYYTLYDEAAVYTVKVRSNGSGEWEIEQGVEPATTYVVEFDVEDPTAYSNALTNDTIGDDYTHTTVWFAVKWSIEAHPDTVVVDYGLPVDISVLSNDMFGDHGHLEAVGAYTDGIENTVAGTRLAAGFGDEYTGSYGAAEIDVTSGRVRYTPTTMDWGSGAGYEKFAYAVNYTGSSNSGYYYDTVTVIPATTVYYEDNFTDVNGDSYITYGKFDTDSNPVTPGWEPEGTAKTDAKQAEDRPGRYSLAGVDANNVYGYDGAYSDMSTYSMGSAQKVHVDANSYATAEFVFYGTGLDIISMTTSNTGTLVMQIFDAETGSLVQDGDGNYTAYTVDTYFGYKYENGEWVVDETADGALYQVPVLKAEGLPYGKYRVVLTASYFDVFDHTTADGYDLYLDAVRIYDPAGEGDQIVSSTIGVEGNTVNTTIADIYRQDSEGWPTYHELRCLIIDAADFDISTDEVDDGIIFIDNTADDPYDNVTGDVSYTVSDYTSYGPNNELYLAKRQAVAFELDLSQYIVDGENIVADVQIGLKSADSKESVAYMQVYSSVTSVSKTTSASTDMYYSIKDMLDLGSDLNDPNQDAKTTIVLQNNGNSGILSITNIKITLKQAPAVEESVEVFRWSRSTAQQAVMMLSAANEADTTTPEETVPEETTPEEEMPDAEQIATSVRKRIKSIVQLLQNLLKR